MMTKRTFLPFEKCEFGVVFNEITGETDPSGNCGKIAVAFWSWEIDNGYSDCMYVCEKHDQKFKEERVPWVSANDF